MTRITGNKIHLKDLKEYDDFDPDLDIDAPAGYTVGPKELPQPTQHPTKPGTIKWFNAFGVKDKDNLEAKVSYTVTMQKLPPNKELYYLIKSGPQLIPADKLSNAGTNDKGKPMVQFTLDVGDPPTGSYP